MKSKAERVRCSIENMLEAIAYYSKDVKTKYQLKQITKTEYNQLMNSFQELIDILTYFKTKKSFDRKIIDQLRAIHLSLKPYYETDDEYQTLYMEFVHANNLINQSSREKDSKRLKRFAQIYKGFTPFYQFRLSKAEIQPEKGLTYRDKGFDNFQCIRDYFLIVKYNFNKMNSLPAPFKSENEVLLNEFQRMIDSVSDEEKKAFLVNARDTIMKFAKADAIVTHLKEMKKLCAGEEYKFILSHVEEMILKYQAIYDENRKLFDSQKQYLMSHFDTFFSNSDSTEDSSHFQK